MFIINSSMFTDDFLYDNEYTKFLSEFGQEDVEVTIELIKEKTNLDWYIILPIFLNEENYDFYSRWRGEKLIELNNHAVKRWKEFKDNHTSGTYSNLDIDYFNAVNDKYNMQYEEDLLIKCYELLDKQKETENEKKDYKT